MQHFKALDKRHNSVMNWLNHEVGPLYKVPLTVWIKLTKPIQCQIKPELPEDQESRVRAESENAHRQELMFAVGFDLLNEWIEGELSYLDNIHCLDFCWKLCAIYMATADSDRSKQSAGHRLYDYLDRICFKGEQTWAFCNSFFGKVIRCSPEEAQDLPGLIQYHRNACDKVTNLWYPRCEPLSAEECVERDLPCTEWRPEDYLILPIFRKLVIIIDEIPFSDEPYCTPDLQKAKGRLVFTREIQDQTATSSISIPDLCAKYGNISPSDNPNVAIGKLGDLVEVVMSLWEEEKPHHTYLGPIVEKLQERMKFKLRDIRLQREQLEALSAIRQANNP